jgi:hypothetical protein
MHITSVCFSVSGIFIRLLQVFHLDVALQCLTKCFPSVLQVFRTYVTSISAVFERMLQVFHLGVVKVDLVLRMLQ